MPHYKISKQVLTIICGYCEHKWTIKTTPASIVCPKCKKEDTLQAKL